MMRMLRAGSFLNDEMDGLSKRVNVSSRFCDTCVDDRSGSVDGMISGQ